MIIPFPTDGQIINPTDNPTIIPTINPNKIIIDNLRKLQRITPRPETKHSMEFQMKSEEISTHNLIKN